MPGGRCRGRKSTKNPQEDEVARLTRHNARLAHRLEQAETIIEIQKESRPCWGFPEERTALLLHRLPLHF